MKKYILSAVLICLNIAAFAAVRVNVHRSDQPPPKQVQTNEYLQPTWSARNKKQGELFLAANRMRPDVISFINGLQYKIIRGGIGENPKLNDIVNLRYQGRFISGKVFDNRYFNSRSLSVPVQSLIPGMRQAVLMMQPNALWEIYVPSQLAYGEKGLPGRIGPNMTLIYRVYIVGNPQRAIPRAPLNQSNRPTAHQNQPQPSSQPVTPQQQVTNPTQ